MQKHNVKCACCNEIFDLNTVQGVRFNGRRYAHQTCFPQGEIVPIPGVSYSQDVKIAEPIQASKDSTAPKSERVQFTDYVQQLFGKENCNWGIIAKQMKQYTEEYHYTYSGMRKTLQWYYEITKHPKVNKNGGIGIIPYNYKQAYDYFYKIFQAENLNKKVTINHKEIQKDNVQVNIIQPKRGQRSILHLMECTISMEDNDEE